MKQLKLTSIIILGICAMLFTACDLLVDGATQTAPLPTVATDGKVGRSEPIITEPVVDPTQVAVINPVATEAPSDESPIDTPSPTLTLTLASTSTPTPTPAKVNNTCLAPPLPKEGLMYASYSVQPGDTLFKIGLAAKPQMTVDEIAAVNCINDVNQIEVGQTVLIWVPSRSIGAFEEIAFVDGLQGRIGRYNGLLENGTLSFQIEAYGNEDLTLFSHTGQFPEITFNVVRKSDLFQVDTAKTTERHYANTSLRGKHIDLPGGGAYLIQARGEPNSLLRLEFILGGPTFPVLGQPQAIYNSGLTGLDLGEFVDIVGSNLIGEYDRYQFFAKRDYVFNLQNHTQNLVILVENSQEQLIYAPGMGHGGSTIIPADDTYTIYLFHGGSHDFLYGDYSFSVKLTDPTPKSETQRIQFEPGSTGTDLIGSNKVGSFDPYLFTTTAGQRADFTIIQEGNVGLWLEDMAGNRMFHMYGQSTGSFLLPHSGDYKMVVYNAAGYGDHGFTAGNYELRFDIVSHPAPVTGLPEAESISFHVGSPTATLQGVNNDGEVARHKFKGTAGQEVYLSFFQDPNLSVSVEDDAGNRLIDMTGRVNTSIWLSQTKEYTITIYKGDSGQYVGGPYEVHLFLIGGDGVVTPEPQEPKPIHFEPGTMDANLVGTNQDDMVAPFVFTASAGQQLDLTILGEENTGLWIEDDAGNEVLHLYGPAVSSSLLPNSGNYYLYIYLGGSHGYLAGSYEVNIGIFDISN